MILVELLPFVLVAVVFWLLILRPAKVRRLEQAALLDRLAPGQRVMTTAGLFGTVTAVDADSVHLEVAPGVVVESVKPAIGRIVAEADADPAPVAPESGAPDLEVDRG